MKSSDELHDLIHSLTVAEKGYFKKYYADIREKSNRIYVELFDAISAQEEYNEALIRKKLKNHAISGYLSKAKSRLWDMIMKCLRELHSKESDTAKIMNTLLDAEILRKKRMIKLSYKKLEQVQTEASANISSPLLLEIMQRKLIYTQFAFEFPEDLLRELHILFEQFKTEFEQQQMRFEIDRINYLNLIYHNNPQHNNAQLKQLENEAALLDENKYCNSSVILHVEYLHLKAVNSFYNGESEKTEIYLRNIIALCKANYSPLYYPPLFSSTMNLSILLSKTNRVNECLELLEEAVVLMKSYKMGAEFIHEFVKFCAFIAIVFIEFAPKARLQAMMNELEIIITKTPKQSQNASGFSARLTLVRLCFVLGQYRLVLRNVNLMLTNKKEVAQSNTFLELRTYEFCCHYLAGNDNNMESITRSIEKQVAPANAPAFHSKVIDFIKLLPQVDQGKFRHFCRKWQPYFSEIKKDISLSFQDEAFITTLNRWLEERLSD